MDEMKKSLVALTIHCALSSGLLTRKRCNVLFILGFACAFSACSFHYRSLSDPMGAETLIDHGYFSDGKLRGTVFRGEKPAEGHRVILRTQPEPLVLEIGPGGIVDVPINRKIIAENPTVEVHGPHGAVPLWNLSFTWAFTVSGCKNGDESEFFDPADLRVKEVGRDAVYSDVGVPPEQVEAAATLLSQEREVLRELFGIDPAPIAIALLDSDPKSFSFKSDSRGRPVWGIRSSKRRDDTMVISFVVHEWTHGILRENIGIRHSPDARFLEDGLCEYVAQRVYLTLRPAGSESSAAVRNRSYRERGGARDGKNYDLIKLAREHSAHLDAETAAETLIQYMEAMCHDPTEVILGYEVGLAWWVIQTDADPHFLERVLAALETDPDLEVVLRKEQRGTPLDSIPRRDVAEVLGRYEN